jgi:hypothetical protein
MRVLIEKYRGFDIEFDTNNDIFLCVATDESAKESSSFAAVKKFVDDYIKSNGSFNPFWVVKHPNGRCDIGKKTHIVGIRKDGRFISQNADGSKDQISDYSLTEYVLAKPANDEHFASLSKLEKEHDDFMEAYRNSRKEVISQMDLVTLKDYKATLSI